MNIRSTILLSVLLLFVISACGTRTAIRPGDTIEVAYDKARDLYDRGRYRDAARAFETVISISRGTEFGQDAQYLLADSYFNSRDYLIAASEFSRYVAFYPRSERAEDAAFMEAMSYYRLSPRYNLDQTDTYNAIERFQLFLSRYPQSARAPEAAQFIDELRTKLSRKMFAAANQYMTLRQFRSAAVYFGLTFERFPETIFAEEALVKQILAYVEFASVSVPDRQAERFQNAIDSYELYMQLFPRGLNRTRAEEYVDRARVGLNRSRQTVMNGN